MMEEIKVFAFGGNDRVTTTALIPVFIDGGTGNDFLLIENLLI